MKYLSLLARALLPAPGVAGAPICKYYPSCSAYASLAIRELGLVRGVAKTAWRLLRCNPWSRGGIDYPSARSAAGTAGGAGSEDRAAGSVSRSLRP